MDRWIKWRDKSYLIAQMFDAWRPIPRLMCGMYGYLIYQITMWFIGLPDPTGAQAAFVSTMVGAAAAFFGFYVNSKARKPDDKE
ncbi:hypothetical protein HOT95_gp041 [Vibrio phage vB_VpS_PG07]|uniref:Holin n=2 Tax=Pogseptimavirus TaxID=2732037 RepID=A0A385E4I5_9CAUD|nr:hypothetical protein HOT95_gp041 [Vibrio phage vB_VpS_PG07]AXQ66666.1 hypothetical protein [Vibrio phage vB_VpS_PG07]QKN88483.1 hypothetical protein vBValSX1_90 [Vibrio phage vB_ValS_X1]